MRRKYAAFFAFVVTAALGAALYRHAERTKRHALSFFAMDTPAALTAYGPAAPAALKAAREAVRALERELSVTDAHSAVARLNAGEALPKEAPAARAIFAALDLCAETDGAFDPTLYPVLRAWGFTTGKYRVPPPGEIARLLKLTGPERVRVAGGVVKLAPGAMIDFGGVGKGMASDAAAAALRAAGVESAVISLGGNVRTLGVRPGGGLWRIGIRDPDGGLLGVLETGEGAVITSGSYERFFEAEGRRWWHILDPRTGAPARSGVVSVTVAGESGTRCDALSTAYFVMGPRRAANWRRENGGEGFIMLTESGELLVSAKLAPRFTPDAAHGAKVTVVE